MLQMWETEAGSIEKRACVQFRIGVLWKHGEQMKHYIVLSFVPKFHIVKDQKCTDGKFHVKVGRFAPLGEPVLWSGYATDSKTAVQAAVERP